MSPELSPKNRTEAKLVRGCIHRMFSTTMSGPDRETALDAALASYDAAQGDALDDSLWDNRIIDDERQFLHYAAVDGQTRVQFDKLGPKFSSWKGLKDRTSPKETYLFLRPLKATGRLLLPNRFNRDSFEMLDYPVEPSQLSLEASIHRVLFKWSSMSMGGPQDALGITRSHSKPVTKWQEHVAILVDCVRFILMVVGETEGVQWEIGHLAEKGYFNKLTIIMPPVYVDAELADKWKQARALARETQLSVPKYDPAGGFFVMAANGTVREHLEFEAIWNGKLQNYFDQ